MSRMSEPGTPRRPLMTKTGNTPGKKTGKGQTLVGAKITINRTKIAPIRKVAKAFFASQRGWVHINPKLEELVTFLARQELPVVRWGLVLSFIGDDVKNREFSTISAMLTDWCTSCKSDLAFEMGKGLIERHLNSTEKPERLKKAFVAMNKAVDNRKTRPELEQILEGWYKAKRSQEL